MVERSVVNRALREVAEAIESFAKQQGWSRDDYHWYYRVNWEWDHLHIILVARSFEGKDYAQNYYGVRDYLKEKLKDATELARSFGLVVMDPKQVASGGIYRIGPEYEDYEDYRVFRPVEA